MLKVKCSYWGISPFCVLLIIAFYIPIFSVANEAYADEWEISDEEIARIQSQAIPMPFPETTAKGFPDQPLRMVYKYNPADRPLVDSYPNADQIIARSMVRGEKADDGPLRITDTEEFPYSSVVQIYMEYDVGYFACSGAFVRNSQLILTAAHCLYHHEEGGFPESITVIPGHDSGERPFGYKEAINWATNNSWINWENSYYDWGVVVVRPFDGDTGFMHTHLESGDSWYYSHDFETAGYPGDLGYPGDEMWWDIGQVLSIMDYEISIGFEFGGEWNCIQGQSGSPMYVKDDGEYYVAAVLTRGYCQGPKINQTLSDFLDDYDCGGCFIEGTCFFDGDIHPSNSCRICDIDQDVFGWSNNDGVWCDDGLFCNGADECQNQDCIVHLGDPCASSQTCDELADQCVGMAIDSDMCNEALNMIYGDCGLTVMASDYSANRDSAFSWCIQNQGPWECIFECTDHPDVNSCVDLSDCLMEKCDVQIESESGGGDDDDDDDDDKCGGII